MGMAQIGAQWASSVQKRCVSAALAVDVTRLTTFVVVSEPVDRPGHKPRPES